MGMLNQLFIYWAAIQLQIFHRILPTDSPFSHILSAFCAGFVSSTATNPIWFVKTRLQLDNDSRSKMNVRECIKRIYETNGLRGFYKGITASYFGISETVVHFVIYEALKKKLVRSFNFQPSIMKPMFSSLLLLRLSYARSVQKKARRPVISLSSCSRELRQRPLHHVLPILMKLHEPDCAKKETNTTGSGRHCSWYGKRREKRDYTEDSQLNSCDKFQTLL